MEVGEEQEARVLAADSNATSLIVGNLHETVTEVELQERFQIYGPVASCHVVRDKICGHSLRYGYVNFIKAWHAALALQVLDGSSMHGQPLRVALQTRGPKVNAIEGNLFINHLDPSITSEELHQIFSTCGPLISTRVATLEDGTSKGYGYVRFVSTEDAHMAIQILHETAIMGKKISVSQFVPRSERQCVAYIPDLDAKKRNVTVIAFNIATVLKFLIYMLLGVSALWALYLIWTLFLSELEKSSILISTVCGIVSFLSVLLYYLLA